MATTEDLKPLTKATPDSLNPQNRFIYHLTISRVLLHLQIPRNAQSNIQKIPNGAEDRSAQKGAHKPLILQRCYRSVKPGSVQRYHQTVLSQDLSIPALRSANDIRGAHGFVKASVPRGRLINVIGGGLVALGGS